MKSIHLTIFRMKRSHFLEQFMQYFTNAPFQEAGMVLIEGMLREKNQQPTPTFHPLLMFRDQINVTYTIHPCALVEIHLL